MRRNRGRYGSKFELEIGYFFPVINNIRKTEFFETSNIFFRIRKQDLEKSKLRKL